MFKILKYKYFKIIIVSLLFFCSFFIKDKNILIKIKDELIKKPQNYLEKKSLDELFTSKVKKHSILIFEPNKYHHECIPGYSNYFLNLGYNVDIIIHIFGIDSLNLFPDFRNIRLFIFYNKKEIEKNCKKLSIINKKYDYILLQSTDKSKKRLYIKLKLFNINNCIFVFHDISWADRRYSRYFKKNRIWTLGNISKCLQVNPHYFGNIIIKNKNEKTRFFLTSTLYRNYTYLIESAKLLKKENFNFEIIILGRAKRLDPQTIPISLSDNFIFKQNVSYVDLYNYVESSDFIIIPLDANSKNDIQYNKTKVTGSAQLVYGFLKPAIINEKFSYFYNLNSENSLLYNNSNLYNIMRNAILLTDKDYKKLQSNLQIIEKEIYKISINNIKKVIKEL